MNKKLVIGGIVLLLVIGGGAFLLLGQTETRPSLGDSGSDTVPTQWSQAGDYEIEEVAGQQTVVTNSKAGFSFKVPEGWRVEDESDGVEYLLVLSSPETKFDQDNFLLVGCFLGIETLFDKASVDNVKASMQYTTEDLNEKIVHVGPYQALQRTISPSVISTDPEVLKKIRDVIQVELPLNEDVLVNFTLNTKKDSTERCLTVLNQTLSQVSFQ